MFSAMSFMDMITLSLTLKKKKSLCMTWSDEETSSNSDSDEDHLNNFVAFTASTVKGSEVDSDENSDGGSNDEFLRTYNIMWENWRRYDM